MSTFNSPRHIVAIGGVTCDSTSHYDMPYLGDFKRRAPPKQYDFGGGAGNFCEALIGLDRVFQTRTHVTLGTKIGKPPVLTKTFEQMDIRDMEMLSAHFVHKFVVSRLHELGIDVIDTLNGKENRIPHNNIMSTHRQRFIELAQENHRVFDFDPIVVQQIASRVAIADLVYGHTSQPLQSLMAFSAPKRKGVPTLLDFSVTRWEDADINRYDELLSHTTHVKMGSDIDLPGLEPFDQHKHNDPKAHEERAGKIIAIMREGYGINYIAVSNNSLPVIVCDNGKRYVIPVEHVEPAHLLGVGDVGMAMTARSMTNDRPWVNAVDEGSQIATESARHPGRTWLEHINAECITEHYLDEDAPTPSGLANDGAMA